MSEVIKSKRPRGRPVDGSVVDEVLLMDMYNRQKRSIKEIADVLGVHYNTVYRRLEGAGVLRSKAYKANEKEIMSLKCQKLMKNFDDKTIKKMKGIDIVRAFDIMYKNVHGTTSTVNVNIQQIDARLQEIQEKKKAILDKYGLDENCIDIEGEVIECRQLSPE